VQGCYIFCCYDEFIAAWGGDDKEAICWQEEGQEVSSDVLYELGLLLHSRCCCHTELLMTPIIDYAMISACQRSAYGHAGHYRAIAGSTA
jgi:hypothetical protein